LRGDILSDSEVILEWSDNSDNENGFVLERKFGNQNYSLIASVGAEVESFKDTELLSNTTYTYRVNAYNNTGNSEYSNEFVLITTGTPELVTLSPFNIEGTTVASGGNIISDGGDEILTKGVVWSSNTLPTIELETKTEDGAGLGEFTSDINNLSPFTHYYIRAYATNSKGVFYGNQLDFQTRPIPAALTTAMVTKIRNTSALSGGQVTDEGGVEVFERGVVWSTEPNPKINQGTGTKDGGGMGSFTSEITNLLPNTTYYVRAFATNASGDEYEPYTSYGNEVSFTTQPNFTEGSGVTDVDGQQYESVFIYGQEWMKENLNVSKYRNGDPIPEVKDQDEWANLTTGAWKYYANKTENGVVYGKLYNWYAITDTRGLAPEGWHIPTEREWHSLYVNLGGSPSGGKMKETGTEHWHYPNVGATNVSNFTALPSNPRPVHSGSENILRGQWWSSTVEPNHGPYIFTVLNADGFGDLFPAVITGSTAYSVRCIRDE